MRSLIWKQSICLQWNKSKKGSFEQKQIYCDRLSSSGNLKAVVVAAWKGIKRFLLKGRKQTLISPTMLTAWRKTRNQDNLQRHQYYPCYLLVPLQVIDTAWQQSDLQFDRLEYENTLLCLVVTLICSPPEYIIQCHPLHLPLPLRIKNTYIHTIYSTRAHARGELISWQSRGPSVWHSRPPPRWTAAGWMAVWGAVAAALCSIEGGIDYVHSDGCMASRSAVDVWWSRAIGMSWHWRGLWGEGERGVLEGQMGADW